MVAGETHEKPTQVLGDALRAAAFLHGCTTQWHTLCVAAVESPSEADNHVDVN